RVLMYYHTQFDPGSGGFVSPSPLVTRGKALTHLAVGAAQLSLNFDGLASQDPAVIAAKLTLNGKSPQDPVYAPMWTELGVVRGREVALLASLGGARMPDLVGAQGRSEADWSVTFPLLYPLLRDYLLTFGFAGLE